jgi:hypothetical protein
MKIKLAKNATYWLSVVAIGLVVGVSLQFVRAWVEPSITPPGGNVGAPISTSAIGQSKAGNLSVNSTFYVPNGNSGFGTLTPSYRVDILGSMRLQPTAAPTGANGVIYYDSSTNKFKCYQNSAWVDCVGINTSGIASCTDATTNKIYWNGSQLTCGNDQTGGGGGLSGSGTLNYVPKWTPNGTTLGNSLIFDNGTNIGIGTTSPGAKLNVIDNIGGNSPALRVDRNGWTAFFSQLAGGAYNGLVNNNDKALIFTDGSQNTGTLVIGPWGGAYGIKILGNNGYVGIGTSSPSQKLDVGTGNVTANDYWINSIGKWASQLAISQQCITKRGAAFSNDQVIWCDSTYPNMYSCATLDDQAPSSPESSSCTSDGSCTAYTSSRTGLGADHIYLEKVIKSGNIYGCLAYDPDHSHTAYKLDIMCCK